MADFPTTIYAPRLKENRSAVVYDASQSKRLYAEDVSFLDAEVVALETYLKSFGGCRVYKSAFQSINNNTMTKISFDSESFDDFTFHDNSINNSRITIPTGKGGRYLITVSVGFDLNSTGIRVVEILKNNTTVLEANTLPVSLSSLISYVKFSCIVNLSAGDYIEAQAFQNSGGALNLFYTDSITTFSLERLL